jgi:hypothetical protein
MSSTLELIDKLKEKPLKPQTIKTHKIYVTESEKASSFIIDKTKETFDRKSFLFNIKDKLEIHNKSTSTDFTKKSVMDKKDKLYDNIEKPISFNKTVIKTEKKIIIREIDYSKSKIPDKKEPSKHISKKQDVDLVKPSKVTIKSEKFNPQIDIDYDFKMGDEILRKRLKEPEDKILIKKDEYYNYDRENFIDFINNIFISYKDQLELEEKNIKEGKKTLDCSKKADSNFDLLIHQKIVRDYINLYTPYRGLLLYHGLGSGKTCSSIAITEGLKSAKEIIIMTPASLGPNYIEELKKCGDFMYKKNQYWEFINTTVNPDYLKELSSVLKLPEDYIKKKGGAWFVNVSKKSNYDTLDFNDQQQINDQINKMISYKYKFINYNGLRNSHIQSLTNNYSINPFSNKVVIVDEAHNLISRIVNKLKQPNSINMKLYDYLMNAENCKIILLSGTPIINYPNEIGILYNILRGYITSYIIKIIDDGSSKVNEAKLKQIFQKNKSYLNVDTISYNIRSKELTITKNPFGYLKSDPNSNKIRYSSEALSNSDFKEYIMKTLQDNKIKFLTFDKGEQIKENKFTALPSDQKTFIEKFINHDNTVKNSIMLKRRIVGLTSYFRSANESLMPKYNEDSFKVIYLEMSKFQFGVHEEARVQERSLEKKNREKLAKSKMNKAEALFDNNVSTYRIFSRAFCNFVFPKPYIKRPMPDKAFESTDNLDEDSTEKLKPEEKIDNINGNYDYDDLAELEEKNKQQKGYHARIEIALFELKKQGDKFLSKDALNIYSPKFRYILESLENPDYKGIHLLYSQFKTLEGIGIFKLVLKYNGFCEFKVKKLSSGEYDLLISDADYGKPMFASYTGDETFEEKNIIMDVLNNNWKMVPSKIVNKISKINSNNNYGEIIKLFMITSSGAEGISLKNVRYVHIMEPYWHPVRIEQVIGRARRICSHSELPIEDRTVEVFLYLMKLSEEQLKSTDAREMHKYDLGKIKDSSGKNPVLTSDQFLYELSTIKKNLNRELLYNIKQSSIDCFIHNKTSSKEKIDCFNIGNANPNNKMYIDNIEKQTTDDGRQLNIKQAKLTNLFKPKIFEGTDRVVDRETNYVWQQQKEGNPIWLGKLILNPTDKTKYNIIQEH